MFAQLHPLCWHHLSQFVALRFQGPERCKRGLGSSAPPSFARFRALSNSWGVCGLGTLAHDMIQSLLRFVMHFMLSLCLCLFPIACVPLLSVFCILLLLFEAGRYFTSDICGCVFNCCFWYPSCHLRLLKYVLLIVCVLLFDLDVSKHFLDCRCFTPLISSFLFCPWQYLNHWHCLLLWLFSFCSFLIFSSKSACFCTPWSCVYLSCSTSFRHSSFCFFALSCSSLPTPVASSITCLILWQVCECKLDPQSPMTFCSGLSCTPAGVSFFTDPVSPLVLECMTCLSKRSMSCLSWSLCLSSSALFSLGLLYFS